MARFASVGARSGLAAWALIFGVPRGALFGAVLALLVGWRRTRRARQPSPCAERSLRSSARSRTTMAESDLYPPIKAFLEGQGYEVKGEVGACDIFAVRGGELPLVVELKERLSLDLILQAVDRLAISETVYVAFRVGKKQSASWRRRSKQVKSLLRRLGVGLLTVSSRGKVVVVLDPGTYRPRPNVKRRHRLLKEFAERIGDPEAGGSASRKRLTVYRQDALRCARHLADAGTQKLSVVRERAGVDRAGTIMRDNHYGWFDRVERGHYALSPKGERELPEWGLVELVSDSA